MLYMLALLQAAARPARTRAYGLIGAGLAAGLAVVGAGIGIGQIGGRRPKVSPVSPRPRPGSRRP